jgi:thioesterase domain-containing protein
MTDDFFDLGGNSLKAMELAVDCNNCFGTDLPISTVFECPTVAEMANAVRAAAIGAARKSVVQLKAGAAASCCVFVHAIGGALFCYQELVARLHGAWPVYGLQPANMSSFAPASLEELARDYLAALDRTIADVPRYFAGWSFGGVVAFEMARQYGASGRSVLGVTLIDTPCRPEPWQGDDDRDILAAAGRVFGVGAAIDPPAGGDVRANEVIRSAAARAGLLIPTEQHIEHVVHLIRNVRRIRRDYRPGRLPTDVTLFRAVAEPQTQPPDFGWGDYVAGKLSVVSLPATHESILKMPHVERIAAHLDCVCSRDVAA